MKIVARSIIAYAKSKKAARKERLHRQACADAQAMIDSYNPASSQK